MAGVGDLIGQIRDLRFERSGGIPLFGIWKNIAVGVFLDPLAHIP